MFVRKFHILVLLVLYNAMAYGQATPAGLHINDARYFEKRGLNVLVFNSHYGLFGDEKLSGVEIIHHEVRTATNGDVRLNSTGGIVPGVLIIPPDFPENK